MPRRDEFHYAVTAALEKEGWKITHDHLDLSVEDTSLSTRSIWNGTMQRTIPIWAQNVSLQQQKVQRK